MYERNLIGKFTGDFETQELQEIQGEVRLDIAHELQTPLAVLKGELCLLQKEFPDNAKLHTLEKSVDDLSTFISNRLELARLEIYSADVPKEEVNLSYLLEQMLEYVDVLMKEQDITLHSTIAPAILLKGRRQEIERLFLNLLSNAIKYISNERKVSVSLKIQNAVSELVVADSGIGIRRADLTNIFHRFYRVENQNISGTGLGLAMCKKIVENHRGTIRIESKLQKGTRVIVCFPSSQNVRDSYVSQNNTRYKKIKHHYYGC